MTRRHLLVSAVCAIALTGPVGCHCGREAFLMRSPEVANYKQQATQIEYPDVANAKLCDATNTLAPRTLAHPDQTEIWELPLEEALRIALSNSKVMRDLGGRVVTAPATVGTVYAPSIQESDPRFGVEGALSAFDAQFTTQTFWERNDRAVNQVVPGFTVPVFEQDLGTFQAGLSKTNATGGTWSVRNNTIYEWNNNPNNQFPSAWNTNIEAEFRQPLLQGSGVAFNRIAGPNATPGFFFSNGVLIARLNHDISLADFEAGLIRLVSDVENAYWDLYFAYRDLDAKLAARDSALKTWQRVQNLMANQLPGGEAENEAQAREQYYLFRAQVEDALSGGPGGSSLSGSGSSAGIFRGAGGVYAREANLRFMLGIAATDGRMIRPSEEPSLAKTEFNWEEILPEALCRRVEIRRQKWLLKRRELELIASRNFLMPRLDAVGAYRWRGFGDDLYNSPNDEAPPFDNAVQNLFDGQFQEWRAGFQFSVPLGQRQALAAVRNAELNVARERSVLQEQELQVSHDLSGAVRELERSYQLTQTNYNRRNAAVRQLAATEAAREAGRITLDVVLDSQRRLADAEVAYFRSMVEHSLAIKSIHFEKGSLLDLNNICLTEGPWPDKAYRDAYKQARRRAASYPINYGKTLPGTVSRGEYRQHSGAGQDSTAMIQSEHQPQPATEEDVPQKSSQPFGDQLLPGPESRRQHQGEGDHVAKVTTNTKRGPSESFEWGGLGLSEQPARPAKNTMAVRSAPAASDKAATGSNKSPIKVVDFATETPAAAAPVEQPAFYVSPSDSTRSGKDWSAVRNGEPRQLAPNGDVPTPIAAPAPVSRPAAAASSSRSSSGWKRAE